MLMGSYDAGAPKGTCDFIGRIRGWANAGMSLHRDGLESFPMLVEAIHKVAHHRGSLSREEARAVMTELLSGKATDAQIAALLVALHMKGETVEEIVGFAEAIRAAAQPISAEGGSTLDVSGTERDGLVDTGGTCGAARDTVQVSTA